MFNVILNYKIFIVVSFFLLDHMGQALDNIDILRGLLHHLHPLLPHLKDCVEEVQDTNLGVEVVQDKLVDSYEGPGTPHTSTAVNKNRIVWNKRL